MTDPILLSVASALAGKAAEAAVEGGKTAWATLVRLVRARFATDGTAAAALETASAHPDDAARVQELARELARITAADAEFRTQLHRLWPTASSELSASEGGVVNSVSGMVSGHVIQAGDMRVDGGLHLGDVHGAG